MKIEVIFCHDKYEPYVIMRYPNADYKYFGFELGYLNLIKKKKLKNLIKQLKLDNVKYQKIKLNI
jgi:hypothetical protein